MNPFLGGTEGQAEEKDSKEGRELVCGSLLEKAPMVRVGVDGGERGEGGAKVLYSSVP